MAVDWAARRACSLPPAPLPTSPKGILRYAPGTTVTMEYYTRVTAAQHRQAADLLEGA